MNNNHMNMTRVVSKNIEEIIKSEAVKKALPGVHVWAIQLSINAMVEETWEEEIQQIHLKWNGKSRSEVMSSQGQKPYVDFMKSLGLNIKKQPPSVANLITRGFTKDTIRFPRIHPVVDAVNIAALQTEVSLGVFDAAHVEGNLQLNFSEGGELFQGIGSDKHVELERNLLVLSDQEKVLSLFSVRDSQTQAIHEETKNVWLLGCQVPGVSKDETFKGIEQAVANLQNIGVKYE
ncbi:B3/B4 domain-containing protein [Algicola sagamiensis]|uniref:B3/B4 domain-containing protein n=1 Tax=Algicola sagamiensis TaxID=163869 RepID=UPI0003652CF2|nr:phenylalanine--tRNA ligase beta subunit-related protein [Algicola sagamiensis]